MFRRQNNDDVVVVLILARMMNDVVQQQQQEPPKGFDLTHNAVPEALWDEIRTWLNLDWNDAQLGLGTSTTVATASFTTSRNSSSSNNNNNIPWEISTPEQNRPVAQFGFRYDYVRDVVVVDDDDDDNATPPIPQVLQKLLQLYDNNDDSFPPFTQCIINAYGPNATAHIPWHADDAAFGPVVLVYTFGAARPLHLRRRRRPRKDDSTAIAFDHYTALPRHLSCYRLQDEARYEWQHAVLPVNDDNNNREWRISITFRSLGGKI